MTTPPAGWTYDDSQIGSSDLYEVRFLVQDTDPALPLLSDAEINYLILKWQPRFDSNTWVAAIAAAVISRKFAGVTTVSADGVSVNVSGLSKQYADIAAALRVEYAQAQSTGVLDISNLMADAALDDGIAPLNFSIGMHDNPEVGQQAYGGVVMVPAIEWEYS